MVCERQTLTTLAADLVRWLQETFPSTTSVLSRMPFALLPFAFPMFILVQALVSTGWVTVFARGWDAWAKKTGTVGSIAGMGFVSVIVPNVSETHSPPSVERLRHVWAPTLDIHLLIILLASTI
jgi:Na+/H+ antiporter NhaD/arsenite permease-like protein